MSGLTAIKAVLEYDFFAQYGSVLLKIDNLDKELRLILKSIQAYYAKYKCQRIGVDELEIYFFHQNPTLPKQTAYKFIFDSLRKVQIENRDLLEDILKGFVELHYMTKISQKANEVIQGVTPSAIDDIALIMDDLRQHLGSVSDLEKDVCNLSLEELLEETSSDGLQWRLPFLRKVFGPVQSQTLGHIFARPDAGKTSIALSEAVYLAGQAARIDRPVLYLSNEEAIKWQKRRAYCSLLGVTPAYLYNNKPEAVRLWRKHGGDNLKLIASVNTLEQVGAYLQYFNPRVCFIDQGPKLSVVGKFDHDTKRLQRIYNVLRQWAADYDCSIVTLGQADNAAENMLWLRLNNLDSSKVAIPGELDWCMGIGFSQEVGKEEVRYLNSCKNKLTGSRGREMVHFDIQKCRFKAFEEETV